ncbi:HAMP domain-containing protein [Caldithrix abyssi]|nr:HAMP domain-containing protein [Caldithrix abyssi]
MKLRVPSFRTQIFLLVLLLVINSALFFRNYFLDSFQAFSVSIDALNSSEKINQLYRDFHPHVDASAKNRFKNEIEDILTTEQQKTLARGLFEKELALYSKFIFVFLTLSVLILFFISFNLITRPLRRLQTATEELTRGNWTVQVKGSKFSPLNDLIISFNTMTKELEENRDKLIQAEKESAWREMARVLAHEIKKPLTPIRLSLERLEGKFTAKSSDLNHVLSQTTSIIKEETQNLQSLATEFSQFSRLPEAVFAHYDLNNQIKNIIEPYRDRSEIELSLDGNLPKVYADKAQIKQGLVNLIQNGIQSSAEGGPIKIETMFSDNSVWITIEDKGVGIQTKDLGKIFEPYFTNREKGTGLGLAIVKRIVEQHHGEISVQSKWGKGTKFTLKFPPKP